VLAAHDWTSLISLEALAEVESRFSISMDLRTFHSARTVPDLAELVAARTTTAGATTAGATATTEGGRR
jgi:acyl carrier protein